MAQVEIFLPLPPDAIAPTPRTSQASPELQAPHHGCLIPPCVHETGPDPLQHMVCTACPESLDLACGASKGHSPKSGYSI